MFIFEAPPTPSVAVEGREGRFPVRRIFCVGRNYADHAREMGADPEREPPFFFTKPADAVVDSGLTLDFPSQTANLHHEAELVVAIGKAGKDVPPEAAESLVFGYACGNDLTRRDLQNQAKESRRPWDMSKGFDQSAVIGAIRQGPIGDATLRCRVNGKVTQEGRLSDMIWPVKDVIAFLSTLVELQAGDLIMTGTPAGVGAFGRGDTCTVEIDGLAPATLTYR